MDRFPRGKIREEQTPGNASLDDIKDGIDHPASSRGWPAQFGGGREKGLQNGPLSVGEVDLA